MEFTVPPTAPGPGDRHDVLNSIQARLYQLAGLDQRVHAIESLLNAHLPRPYGRPEFISQFNVADALAWRAADSSAAFVEKNMRTATIHADRYENLAHAARNAPADGLILEFGVGAGDSLRWLQNQLPGRRVIGFDSFKGLPEDWRSGFPEGFFGHVRVEAFGGESELCVGWFEQTIPEFFASNDERIALLHVDCDLYSSTRTVLERCMPRLAPGAVVVFDEFFNYPGWQHHEAKAWSEYLGEHPAEIEYLSYVPSHEEIAVRVNPVNAPVA